MGGTPPAPELAQHEYKARCRLVVEGQEVVMALLYELADGPGGFNRLASLASSDSHLVSLPDVVAAARAQN
jgi:hypothetical protein